jgi:hypothetical protein
MGKQVDLKSAQKSTELDVSKEIEKRKKELQELEKKKEKKVLDEINKIADEAGYKVGVILDKNALLQVIQASLNNNGNAVQLNINLYQK